MKKALRVFLWVIVILVILYLLAMLALSLILKPERYKPIVTKTLFHHTGRIVELRGRIRVLFFPWPGINIKNMQINNPVTFKSNLKNNYFAQIENTNIRIAFWPLFAGKIEPKTIVMDHVHLQLVTNIAGEQNWHFAFTPNITSIMHPEYREQGITIKPFRSLNIAVKNTDIDWINEATHTHFFIKDLNFIAQPMRQSDNLKIKLNFNVVDTDPTVSLFFNGYTALLINRKQNSYELSNLTIDAELNQLFGQITKPIPLNLQSDVLIDADKKTLILKQAQLQLADAKAKLQLQASNLSQASLWQGNLTFAAFNPTRLLSHFNLKPNSSSSDQLEQAAGSVEFTASTHFLRLEKLLLQLDKMQLLGNVDYSNFNRKNLKFNLTLNNLDLDKINAALEKSQKTVKKLYSMSLQKLKPWDWQGDLSIGNIVYRGYDLQQILLRTQKQQGVITFNPMQAEIGQGTINSAMEIDLREPTPKYHLQLQVHQLPAAILFKLINKKDYLTGDLNFNSNLVTQGNSPQACIVHLNGQGQLSMKNGVINGIDFLHHFNTGLAYVKQSKSQSVNTNSTSFSRLNDSFVITDGLLTSSDFLLYNSNLQITGKGYINFLTNLINFGFNATLPNEQVSIPIVVQGPLTSPRVQVHLGLLGQQLIGQYLQNLLKHGIDLKKLLP